MDAVKFLEERKRKFNNGESVPALGADIDCNYEDAVKEIEEWSAANPRKTRQDVFLEQYPNAVLDKDGVIRICPAFVSNDVSEKYSCLCLTDCGACRLEFWMQEVE